MTPQSQAQSQYQQFPNQQFPSGFAGYPAPPMPEAKVWPTPPGHIVPLVWMLTLIIATLLATVLALIGPALGNTAIAPGGTAIYASSLAHDDHAWTLTNEQTGTCAFADGNLNAQSNYFVPQAATQNGLIANYEPLPLCTLQAYQLTDLHLSVRLLPSGSFQPAIFVHEDVAFLFTTMGQILVVSRNGNNVRQQIVASLQSNQWHTATTLSNTVDIQVSGMTYTLGVNGTVVYQGTFSGRSANFSSTGRIALGVYTTSAAAGGAIFADLTVTAH